MKAFTSILLFCLICCTSVLANSDTPNAKKSIFDYWTEANLQEITLHLDFAELESNRMTINQMIGQMTAGAQTYEVKIDVRGRFRRRTCEVPPLKLHLDKDGLRQFGFSSHNDFKLVTHCTSGKAGQDALVREELVYELYRQLNPTASFRTRLVTIHYVDSQDGSTTTSYGILIEDKDELENRLSAKDCKTCFNLPLAQVKNAAEVALFQYMIGNADFSLIMARNVKMMATEDGTYTAVPYDFDFSGLVNAKYARPNVDLGQLTIKDRIWNWEYDQDISLEGVSRKFLAQKDQVLATVANFPNLSEKSKKEITKYLKGFYRELGSSQMSSQSLAR